MTNSQVDEQAKEGLPAREASQPALTRRGLVSRSGLMALGAATAPLWLPKAVARASSGGSQQHTLLFLFLPGGFDGLSAVAPRGAGGARDPFYVEQRKVEGGPQLAIPLPSASNGVVGLTDANGVPLPWMLSEGAAAVLPMFENGDLAFVHGVGLSVENNGSHFYSQDYLEDGTLIPANSDGAGWAGRAMIANTAPPAAPWRGMGYGKLLQRTLFGAPGTISIPDLADFDLNGSLSTASLRKLVLEGLYNVSDEPLKSAALNSLEIVDALNTPHLFDEPDPDLYPTSPFGQQMKRVQQLMCSTLPPLETIMLTYGGWDDHALLGPTPHTTANPSSENMHLRMKDLFDTLAVFYAEMQSQGPNTNYTLCFATEFGRRITANSNAGIDHGKGSLMGIMGSSGINGRKVFTMLPSHGGGGTTPGWNGLEAHSVLQSGTGMGTSYDASYNMRDTIDYRRVLGELFDRRLMFSTVQVDAVFPGYAYKSAQPDTHPIGVFL